MERDRAFLTTRSKRKGGSGYGGRRVRLTETYRILHPNAVITTALAFRDLSTSLTIRMEMRIRATSVIMSIVPMMAQRAIYVWYQSPKLDASSPERNTREAD